MENKDKMKVAVYCRVGSISQVVDVKKEEATAHLYKSLSEGSHYDGKVLITQQGLNKK